MLDTLERALWTGVQTGLAFVTVEGLTSLDANAATILLTAGVASAISALKTLAVERSAALKLKLKQAD